MSTVDPLTAANKASYPSVSLLVPIDGEPLGSRGSAVSTPRCRSVARRARPELAEDSRAPDVNDNVVDEIIEAVLAAGGRVEITPAGVLAGHQRIAFVPWERRRRR